MSDDKVIKGVIKGLGQLGVETAEKLSDESQKILESTITGKQLLGLEQTMNEGELALKKHEDDQHKAEEIKKIKGEIGQNGNQEKPREERRDVEGEMEKLRQQKEKEEEEKEKYFEQMKKKQEQEKQMQEAEYDNLMLESSNPAKQKKSRGSAFVGGKKKKQQPDQSQMSQTQEFKGKID